MAFRDLALAAFDELVAEIGEHASVAAGAVVIPDLGGFMHLTVSEEMSLQYRIDVVAASFECRADAVSAIARPLDNTMTLTFNGIERIIVDIRPDAIGALALIVLDR